MLLKGRKTPRRMRGEGGDAFERNFPSPVCHFGGFYASPLQCAIGFCSAPLTSCASPLTDSSTEIFPLYLDISSYVSQKRGRPEHPTPLPCIAINRVFPRKVGLYAHLACGTKLAKHAVIGAPSSKAFVRRPLLPCPVPFMICGQPIFRES